MPFYAFRLDALYVRNQRGKIPDDDIVTFQVAVNNVLRGQGAIILEDVTSGTLEQLVPPPSPTYTFTPLAPNPASAKNIDVDWIIGAVHVNRHLYRIEWIAATVNDQGRGGIRDSDAGAKFMSS
jgi:hypothetical protein